MKKRMVSLVLAFCYSLIFAFSALAVGDGNMDGGGGGLEQGSSQNSWSPGNDGIRVTVVRAADRTPVSRPIDLTNKKPKISYSFGKVSKIALYKRAVIKPGYRSL